MDAARQIATIRTQTLGVRAPRRVLLALPCLAAISALAAADPIPTQRVTLPDGTTVELAAAGSGASVVLQSGLGDDLHVWQAIWSKLARFARVFAYNRPGYGASTSTRASRDPCTVATEMHELLHSQRLPRPYVLVGHSLGGLYQWAYAAQYPEDVAALVLLDPTHPQHWERLQQDAPGSAAIVRTLRAAFTPAARAEFDDQSGCLQMLDATRARSVPARLLVRTRYEVVESGAFRRTVTSLQTDWLTLVDASSVERVSGSGHYLQKDRPDVVVGVIRDVLAEPAP
jgi:pimeloyl-ACP methyl ester carboxylesterase